MERTRPSISNTEPPRDYGSTTTVQDIGGGTSSVNFGIPLTGLAPGTTYHVRAVVSNGGTTTDGVDQTFVTPTGVPAMPGWGWVALTGILLVVPGHATWRSGVERLRSLTKIAMPGLLPSLPLGGILNPSSRPA